MSQRWRCRGVAWIVSVVALAAAPGVRAEESRATAGTVLVNLTPSESVQTLRLRSYGDSVPIASCKGACSVRVQIDVPYELDVTDEHGTTSTGLSFSQPEHLRVTPPSHVMHFIGKSMLIGGAAVLAARP